MNLKAKINPPIIQQPQLPKPLQATTPILLRLAHLCQYRIRTVQTRQLLRTIQKSFCERQIDLNLKFCLVYFDINHRCEEKAKLPIIIT